MVHPMARLPRISLYLLVILWLPVTLHCRLEAAGLFAPHDDCAELQAAHTGSDCKDDSCPLVEDALYKESTQGPLFIAPDVSDLIVLLELPAPCSLLCTLSPERHAPPPELRVTWQFVARAAPPARAPSLNS